MTAKRTPRVARHVSPGEYTDEESAWIEACEAFKRRLKLRFLSQMATREAFLADIANSFGDPTVRLIYADWLAEQGFVIEEQYQRWMALRPGVIYGDKRNPEDPWSYVVNVWWERFPKKWSDKLPHSIIDTPPGVNNPTHRITEEMWSCREEAEKELFAAWYAAYPVEEDGYD